MPDPDFKFPRVPDNVTAGQVTKVQIAPFGNWPIRKDDGSITTQLIDEEAVRQIVGNFSEEVLVDADHSSEKGGKTEALAWIISLEEDPERGLVGSFRWTDIGAEAINGRRYRFVSGVWYADRNNRPIRLLSVGLTNLPNIHAHPILNSAQGLTPRNAKGEHMDIRTVLELAADATDEEVVQKVTALKEEIEDLRKKMLEKEADDFVRENSGETSDPEALKNSYMRDPALTRSIMMNIRRPSKGTQDGQQQRLLNSRMASTPSLPRPSVNAREEMAMLPPDQRQAFYNAHKAEIDN